MIAAKEAEAERLRSDVRLLQDQVRLTRESVAWGLLEAARTRFYARVGADSNSARAMRRALAALRAARARRGVPVRPIALRSHPRPLVSIVVPARGHPDSLAATLRSVADGVADAPYEVIVVDEGADPAATRVARTVENARLGAADDARGRFLLSLTAGTELVPGCLESLLARAEAEPGAGAVVPRLLRPDGRLREAGAIAWRDGSIGPFGHGDHAGRPEYGFRREVDCASTDAMLVRADAWRAAGGLGGSGFPLGPRAAADLCFRLRAAGRPVLYEPTSAAVVHGATRSGEEAAGERERFADRWREVLEDAHHSPGERHPRRACARHRGPHVFVADSGVPTADRDAGSRRMAAILDGLVELRCRVTFMPLNAGRPQPYADELRAAGVEVLNGLAELRQDLAALGPGIDLAILSRPDVALACLPAVRELAPSARVAYDASDVHFVREARRAALEGASAAAAAEAVRAIETTAIECCDLTICVSEEDRAAVAEAVPGASTEIVSLVQQSGRPAPGREGRSGVVFVGNYQHAPNVDAARRLALEVMPLVRDHLPGNHLTLAGPAPPPEVAGLASPDVTVTGWVEDLAPLLDRAVAQVAPVRFGAGVKGKLVESLALGLPVVTTPVGAEGLGGEDGRHLLVADAAEGLARHVVDLHRDPVLWASLSRAGRELAERRWSPSRARDALARILGLEAGHAAGPAPAGPR